MATTVKENSKITMRDIAKVFWRWQFTCEMSNSYERMQAIAFCFAMIPVLKKLYPNKEDFVEALQRHLVFFNTEGTIGSVIVGMTVALEEEKVASDGAMTGESIIALKSATMGPIAGIGDTIDWSTIKPLMAMLCLPLAESGSFLATVIYMALVIGILTTEEFFFVNIGYRMGTEAAMTILGGGMVNKFISCASVLGMFMMGGLSASMVNVYTTAQIPTGEGTVMAIQGDILDAVAPGLLTLAAVLLVYKYLRSGHSMMKATFWILGIGLVLGAVGVIGDGGFLIKPLVEAAA